MILTRGRRRGLVWAIILASGLWAGGCSIKSSETKPPDIPDIPNTEMFPEERLIEWGRAGVWDSGTKGIPDRSTVFCNVKVSIPGSALVAKGDGVQDDTAALRAAITGCPSGQVVFVPQGTYRLTGTLNIGKGIVIRGEGPDKTRFLNASDDWAFRFSGDGSVIQAVNITSGYQRGSDTVVVASGSQFRVGGIVVIDQLNDPDLVSQVGVESCTWCGRDGLGGTRAMGETLLVQEKSGNTIKFNRPLYYDYKSQFQPQLYQLSDAPVLRAGIEDLAIDCAAGTGDNGGIEFRSAAYCWLENVECANPAYKHVMAHWGTYGCEIRACYFHDAQYFTGDRGYGVHLFGNASDNLVEDNIFYHTHIAVAIEAGGAGNVIGYNFSERTEHHQADWFQTHIGTHGSHPYMNLFEGNVVGKVHFDNYFGSSSHNTYFRNHITRLNPGTPVANDIIAAIVDSKNYYETFVGNVLGTEGCQGPAEQIPYTSITGNPVLWKIGFDCCAETGNPTDARVAQTLIRTGNWECSTNTIQWDPSIPERNMPDSLYRVSKPDWFGVLDWPPFTPERAGFNPADLNKIPAQVRYETGPALGLGYMPARGY